MTELRVGLIGAGGISHVHADAWRALGATVTVASLEGAAELAAEYGFASANNMTELLPDVDIVDIVTPSSTHADLAREAISAGKHVVCEKPLAASAAEAEEIAALAHAAGVRLFPAHVVRYFPEYARLKQQLDAGAVGTVATLRFYRMGAAPASSWFFSESGGGGIILDLMIHDIDQALWFAGDATEVYAVQNPPTVDDHVPSPVTAHVVLTHASGAISHLQATWVHPELPFRTRVEVSGTTGRLVYDSALDTSVVADLPPTPSEDYMPPMSPADSPYFHEIVDFIASLSVDHAPRVTARDGISAVRVAEAAYTSIRTGSSISLAEVSP